MSRHPDPTDLALFSGSDLPFWKQWQVSWHVRSCPSCSAEVASYRVVASMPLPEPLLANVAWEPLAEEMRANIRLGLEASEAIAAYSIPHPAAPWRLSWRPAALVTALILVFSSGWWFAVSAKKIGPPLAHGAEPAIVEATDAGVEITDGALSLELRTPASRASFVSVTTRGVAETRYTDAETGQITVNHVYLD